MNKKSEFIINQICTVFNTTRDIIIKPRTKKRTKGIDSLYRYLIMNYLEEHSSMNMSEIGHCIGLKYSSVSIGLKTSHNLFFTRDIQFNDMLDKLNNSLSPECKINMSSKTGRYKRNKLTSNEIRHLKFMIECGIPLWKMTSHFRVSLATLKQHERKFNKNDIK